MLLKIERSLTKIHLITLIIVIVGSIIISSSLIVATSNDPISGLFISNWVSNSTAVAAVTVAIMTTLTAVKLHKSMRNSNKKNGTNDDYYSQITEDAARRHFYSLQSLTMGLILWLIAEFIWTYYRLVIGIANPFPSVADGFWLAGYPLFLYFVLGMNKAIAKDGVYDREALILISIAAGLALAYIFSLLFGIQDLVPSIQDRLGWTISLLYPIFDTILLVPSLVLIGSLRSRKDQSAVTIAWLLMAGSIVVVTVADIAFSYSQRFGAAADIEWFTDILYSASYIFMAGALYWYYRVLTIYSERIKFRKG